MLVMLLGAAVSRDARLVERVSKVARDLERGPKEWVPLVVVVGQLVQLMEW